MHWIPRTNLHVTMKFIGDAGPDRIERIKDEVRDILKSLPPIEIKTGKLDFFGRFTEPRVLFISVSGPDSFQRLGNEIHRRFVKENRPFHSHLTIAKFRERLTDEERATNEESLPFLRQRRAHSRNSKESTDHEEASPGGSTGGEVPFPLLFDATLPVNHITLFESIFEGRAVHYEIIEQLPLSG